MNNRKCPIWDKLEREENCTRRCLQTNSKDGEYPSPDRSKNGRMRVDVGLHLLITILLRALRENR